MPSDPIMVDELVGDVTFLILNHRDYDQNTDTDVRHALDAVLQEMVAKTQFAAFKKYDTFSTANGVHTYRMPDDYVQIVGYGLQYATTPFTTLRWITERSFLEEERERNQSTGEPTEFFITHKDHDDGLWRFRLHPTPNATRVINRCYLSMPTSIRRTVMAGDHELDPRFPTQFIKGIASGAAMHFPQYLDQVTLAACEKKYQAAITDMANKSEPTAGITIQKHAYGGGGRFGRGPIVNIPNIRL